MSHKALSSCSRLFQMQVQFSSRLAFIEHRAPLPWAALSGMRCFSFSPPGVWATQVIPKGKRFGPFVGEKKKRSQVTSNVYMWEVCYRLLSHLLVFVNSPPSSWQPSCTQSGLPTCVLQVYFPARGWLCVDATDPMKGNWLRYVNWAHSSEEQNLFPLEINRAIYYKVLRVGCTHAQQLIGPMAVCSWVETSEKHLSLI